MKLFLDSELRERYQIVFLKTNFRKTNRNKGKITPISAIAVFWFFARLVHRIVHCRPALAYYPVTPTQWGWIGRDVWCLGICRLFHVKTVIHFRGSHLRLNFDQFHPLAKRLVRQACREVSAAIVQADCLRDQFDGLVPADRVQRLYQAIDTGKYANPDLSEFVRGKILFVGHMTKAKGYCDLLRAMGPVVEKHPYAQFYFAGTLRKGERGVFFDQSTGQRIAYEDPFQSQLRVKATPAGGHYHNLGIVVGTDMLRHLRECDIFVLPSYSEGFSRALLEAMCVGKPIVYTPVGAHREILRDGIHGLTVAPGDCQSLAKCICRLLEDRSLRDRIAYTNYERVRRDFDISMISQGLSDIFEFAMHRNGARA